MLALILAAGLSAVSVDRVVDLVMRTQQVAGMSVGIARAGATVFQRGYGFSDLGRRERARAATVYRIGSLTKSFTAAAILDLVSARTIALSDPAARYVQPFPWSPSTTIEQLLTHQSGIPSYSDNPHLRHNASYAPADLIRGAAQLPVRFEPGRYWSYSNTNYILLGMIVERASAISYGAYVQRHLLDPMKLFHTRYGDQAGQAHGYARDTIRSPVIPSSLSFGYAAAGMTSNVPDLLTWLQVLQPPYYGMFESGMNGTRIVYVTGSVDGFSSVALICPQTRDAIVVLANANQLDLLPLVEDLYALVTGRSDVPAGQSPPAPRRNAARKSRAKARAAWQAPYTRVDRGENSKCASLRRCE
jgi:CubicO group peptidase (beta-lactamase class C family)